MFGNPKGKNRLVDQDHWMWEHVAILVYLQSTKCCQTIVLFEEKKNIAKMGVRNLCPVCCLKTCS